MAFTYLKVKSAKCLCLLPVVLVLVLRIWSCLHHCILGARNSGGSKVRAARLESVCGCAACISMLPVQQAQHDRHQSRPDVLCRVIGNTWLSLPDHYHHHQAVVTTMIRRLRFDGRSTAYQRSFKVTVT